MMPIFTSQTLTLKQVYIEVLQLTSYKFQRAVTPGIFGYASVYNRIGFTTTATTQMVALLSSLRGSVATIPMLSRRQFSCIVSYDDFSVVMGDTGNFKTIRYQYDIKDFSTIPILFDTII